MVRQNSADRKGIRHGKKQRRIRETLLRIRKSLVLLVLFAAISTVSFHVIQNNLLDHARVMGDGLALSYSVEEEKNITAYQVLMNMETNYLDQFLESKPSEEELKAWLSIFYKNTGEALGKNSILPYAVINGAIIPAIEVPKNKSYDPTSHEWYHQADAADGAVIFSDMYQDSCQKMPVITIAKKCKTPETFLAFDIFPEKFRISTNSQELPNASSYYLCDKAGNVLYSETSLEEERMDPYLKRILNGIHEGTLEEDHPYVINPNGEKRGVYYEKMDNGWTCIVTIPYKELLGNFWNVTLWYMGLFNFCFALVLFMGVNSCLLSRKMKRINETVQVLGNSFYAIYRVNFKNDVYDMIKGSEYVRSQVPEKGRYSDFLKIVGGVIEEHAYQEFIESFSLSNINHLVSQKVQDYGGDFRRRFQDGYRWVSIRFLYDESLNKDEAVLCFREVDEEKKSQLKHQHILETALDRAKKNEDAQNRFFSAMSHDMRTPLSAIIGMTELAEKHPEDTAQVKSYLRRIGVSSRQLLGLINDILEMSRVQKGKITIENSDFDLKAAIGDYTAPFAIQAERENKKFSVSFQARNHRVRGDAFRLGQVMNNLLSNAFKFTKPGDSISVCIRQEELSEDRFCIVVSDTGAGMSEEFLTRLFLPYERETRFGAKYIAGTGLGMTIVKSIVSQMDGQIKVDSRLGEGSMFTLLLPFEVLPDAKEKEHTETALEGSEAKEGSEREYTNLSGLKILLAEDNEINMEICREMLGMAGIQVTEAWNGREALEAFRASSVSHFDAVLMDMQMPEMDGCAAAMAIRNLKNEREDAETIPIIAITANAFSEDIAATEAAGMNAHISKPIDFPVLCRTLERLTGNRV